MYANFRHFCTLAALTTVLSACSQTPAQIVEKGHNFYGHDSSQPWVQMASRASAENASEDYAMAAPVAPLTASPVSDFNASPSTVSMREDAAMNSVSVSELAPISSKTLAPQTPPVTASSTTKQQSLAAMNEEPLRTSSLPEPQARVVAENTIPAAPKAVPHLAKGLFTWPVKGKIISGFGPKAGGTYNDGINIAANEGDNIAAAADGTVVYAGNELRGYGNMVIVRHKDGWMTAYAHASKILVKKGDKVKQGTAIALVGKTGSVESAQVHFGLRKGKEPVDPMVYLSPNQFASR